MLTIMIGIRDFLFARRENPVRLQQQTNRLSAGIGYREGDILTCTVRNRR